MQEKSEIAQSDLSPAKTEHFFCVSPLNC